MKVILPKNNLEFLEFYNKNDLQENGVGCVFLE